MSELFTFLCTRNHIRRPRTLRRAESLIDNSIWTRESNRALEAMKLVDPAMLEVLTNKPMAEKRLGTVEEIAHVVAFLAEDKARWINGQSIDVTGGCMAW